MQLFIRSQENYVFNFSENTIIADVKAFIAEKEGLPIEDVVLYVGGSPLGQDDEVLSPDFAEGSLDVTVRLLGGKVHGSLARAGKVKGQTPKVEKQEKKKKKTGRAKRRIQYNRRFVNVVATIGKRRGPNSNST